MHIFLQEHKEFKVSFCDNFTKDHFLLPRKFKTERGKNYHCYSHKITENEVVLNSDYFVGLDWFTQDRFILVEPKLNFAVSMSFETIVTQKDEDISEDEIKELDESAEKKVIAAEFNDFENESVKEVNVIAMLMDIMSHSEVAKETNSLLLIDWEAPEIEIEQKQDLLTPFLVVKFLKLLQDITRKGLKKSYYKVQENLKNRVKGKILVGKQIKQNIFKNRFTNTVCEYQVFGEDSLENRFLKKVFLFCTQYVENNEYYFKSKNDLSGIVNFIRPAFEHVGSEVDVQDIKHLKYNPFFKEYKDTIKIGRQILKRFSYNITTTTGEKISTPPFWIDMPKMFELYVYAKLLKDNSNLNSKNLNYQFSTYGNSLDFLISTTDKKIVVDTKYKLKYNFGEIHEDIRQVAGYARLNKVRKEVGLENSNEIPCLIIYPKQFHKNDDSNESLNLKKLLKTEINAYHNVYKIGVSLPII